MKLLGLCAAALLLTACGSGPPAAEPKAAAKPKAYDVHGTLTLSAVGTDVLAENGHKGAQCYGQNGYEDIKGGTQVVVRDDKGKTVGVADLNPGVMATGLYASNAHCEFRFTVPGVDSTADFLSVEVAHRGQVQFKRTDASAVALTLGDAS